MAMKQKRQIRNINSELPSLIIEIIFWKLPFYRLPSCRIVCKEWNDLILTCKFDPQMWINSRLLFHHTGGNLVCAEFDPNSVKRSISIVTFFNFHPKFSGLGFMSIVSSCNGLLCLLIRKFSRKDIYILNPTTNEDFKLPVFEDDTSIKYLYCLGFGPKTKQYKLVRASCPLRGSSSSTLVEIFAFGTSSQWKPFHLISSWNMSPSSLKDLVYSNGGFHLLIADIDCVIYRLDIEEEEETIREVSSCLPGMFHQMVDLDGTLYVTFRVGYVFQVWKMIEDCLRIILLVPSGPSASKCYDFKIFKAYGDEKILCKYKFDFILYDLKLGRKEVLGCQHSKIMKTDSFHLIGSCHFNPLPKILAGNN